MMKVPKNKTVYVGAKRYIEGDLLPPFVMLEMPVLTKKQVEKIAIENEKPRRRKSAKRFEF